MGTMYLVGLLAAIFLVASCAGYNCAQDSDCVPPELAGEVIPPAFVSCLNDSCACDACFSVNASSGRCRQAHCFTYMDDTCYDNRHKHFWAIVFSVFFTWTGVANFYINRLDLAIPQVAIGAVILVLTAAQFVHRQILKRKERGELTFYVCFAFAMLFCWAEIAWWVADVVVFATNTREDGSGCTLV